MTHSELLSLVLYEAHTGNMRRMGRSGDATINGPNGYRAISIRGKRYLAHRVAWYYMNGNWPHYQIDHINGDKTDNRIENLRDVPSRTNQQNLKRHRSGKLLGAGYRVDKKKWRAQIYVDGKKMHLGYFSTEKEASDAYMSAVSGIERRTMV